MNASLGVELSQVVSAEAGVCHSLVVIIVDVLVSDDAGELGLLQLSSCEEPNLLQLLHALHKFGGTVDGIGIGFERPEE